MKCVNEIKKQPSPKKCSPTRLASDSSLFFRAMLKAADITQKEITYELRVSRTLTDGWMNGTKNDPFTQARRAVKPFIDKNRKDLLAAIILYIVGDDSFDEVVQERIQQMFAKPIPKIRDDGLVA